MKINIEIRIHGKEFSFMLLEQKKLSNNER